jgi:hypothetical protein
MEDRSAVVETSAFAEATAGKSEDGHLFFDIATKVASDVRRVMS